MNARRLAELLALLTACAAGGCGLGLDLGPPSGDAGRGDARPGGDAGGGADGGLRDAAGLPDAAPDGPDAGEGAALEICGNALDDDGDSRVDEDCACDRWVVAGADGDGRGPAAPAGGLQAAIDALEEPGGVVCVGALADPAGATPCRAELAEDVDMRSGVSVLGAFAVRAGTWARPSDPLAGPCVTSVRSSRADGLRFPHGAGNDTRLDGMKVIGAALAEASAITVEDGATIRACAVEGVADGRSVGVLLRGSGSPVLTESRVVGAAAGAGEAVAVRVEGAAAQLRGNVSLAGGAADSSSTGVEVDAAAGVEVADNARIAGGSARFSYGVSAAGASGLLVEGNARIEAGPAGVAGAAVAVRRCSTPATIRGNGALAASGTLMPAVGDERRTAGVDVEGCVAEISDNALLAGSEADTALPAHGVDCHGGLSSCNVRGNRAVAGLLGARGTVGHGVLVQAGARALVERNRAVDGCGAAAGSPSPAASACFGVRLAGADPATALDGNQILSRLGETVAEGIRIEGDGPELRNNLVEVDRGVGIHHVSPGDRVTFLRFNTLVHGPAVPAGAVVLLHLEQSMGTGSPTVLLRNNVFACLDGVATADGDAALVQGAGAPILSALDSNDFFGCEAAARTSDSGVLGTIEELVAWARLAGTTNHELDPEFVDPPGRDYHLRATSPLVDRACALCGQPPSDFDGDPRPPRLGGTADIGMDEARY